MLPDSTVNTITDSIKHYGEINFKSIIVGQNRQLIGSWNEDGSEQDTEYCVNVLRAVEPEPNKITSVKYEDSKLLLINRNGFDLVFKT